MNWGYIVLAYLSLFALGLGDNSRGPLFPEILKTFQVSDTQGSIYFALSSFLGFLGSYSARFLILKFNRVKTLQLSLVLMVVGLVGMGGAPGFASLLFFSAVFGLAIGILGVVQNVLVTVGATPARRQQLLSGLHAFYGISSLLAPLVAAGIATLGGSWRSVFFAVAFVPLALMIGAFWKKEDAPPLKIAEVPVKKASRFSEHGPQIFLGFALGCYVLAEIMMSTRLALYIRREMGLDLQQSSYYLTGFFVGMLIGRVIFTVFHFKWSLLRMLSASLLLSALSISLGILVSPWFFVLCGLTMAPFYPLAVAYIFQNFEKRIDAAISTSMAIQAFLTVLMHAGVGALTDRYGIAQALWVGPAALILAFLILNSFETVFNKRG
jgi:FHS family glucose/mannose:H+ symporter-like MFS transporter